MVVHKMQLYLILLNYIPKTLYYFTTIRNNDLAEKPEKENK